MLQNIFYNNFDMNTEGYTCYVPRMGTDYRITPYSYITSFVCCHPEGSESEATRKISEISVLQKISFACFSLGHEFSTIFLYSLL